MSMLIEVKKITKCYGEGETIVHALKEVDLSVERGEFVAVVGSSGSGKSTLLHLLGGLDQPTHGEIFMDGEDIYKMSSKELTIFRRRSIGFVFQNYNLIPMLNVYDNILLPSRLDGVNADENYVETLIHTLGLSEKIHSMPHQLSGGQQQRVAIARALSTKPQIVLADEPTGNLDTRNSMEVVLLLKELNNQYGQTIVMITHNEEIASMAKRQIRIEDGTIVFDSLQKGFVEVGE